MMQPIDAQANGPAAVLRVALSPAHQHPRGGRHLSRPGRLLGCGSRPTGLVLQTDGHSARAKWRSPPGHAEPDARKLRLKARARADRVRICSTTFIEQAFRTDSVPHRGRIPRRRGVELRVRYDADGARARYPVPASRPTTGCNGWPRPSSIRWRKYSPAGRQVRSRQVPSASARRPLPRKRGGFGQRPKSSPFTGEGDHERTEWWRKACQPDLTPPWASVRLSGLPPRPGRARIRALRTARCGRGCGPGRGARSDGSRPCAARGPRPGCPPRGG